MAAMQDAGCSNAATPPPPPGKRCTCWRPIPLRPRLRARRSHARQHARGHDAANTGKCHPVNCRDGHEPERLIGMQVTPAEQAKQDGVPNTIIMLWDDEDHWVLRVNKDIDIQRLRYLGEFLVKTVAEAVKPPKTN